MSNLDVSQSNWFAAGQAAIANSAPHSTLGSGGRAARDPGGDFLGDYLSSMVDSPILSRADECRLGLRVQAAQRNYRVSLLTCQDVLVGVIDLLERIQRRELRLDRYFDVAVSDVEQKRSIRQQLGSTIRQLKVNAQAIRQGFRTCLKGTTPAHTQRQVWRQVAGLRREAALLANTLKIRTSILADMLGAVQAKSRRMSWLRTLKRTSRLKPSHEFNRQLQSELNALMLGCADSPATLDRRLRRLNGHYVQYTHLRKQLAAGNLRFVVAIAKQYRGKELPFTDLIQEGSVGLLRAIEKFDPRKGFRLTTYAEWWIRQAIQVAISQASGPIRVPHNLKSTIRKIHLTRDRLAQVHGRRPRLDEIAGEVGLSATRVGLMLRLANKAMSLSQALSESNDGNFGELVEDRPGTPVLPRNAHERLDAVMEVLDPRERQIIQLRFGLTDGVERTLTEIGRRYQLSRERIRQIENRAVNKLRQPTCLRALSDLMPND